MFNNRFESHHIRRESLPQQLIEAIQNKALVPAKTEIGTIVDFDAEVNGVTYNHIHYSILDKDGIHQNPMWFSKPVSDSQAPKIKAVYALLNTRCRANGLPKFKELSQLDPSDEITHLILQAEDFIDNNSLANSPTKLHIEFEDGSDFDFDFSRALFNACLLYTSPSPRDQRGSRMPSSA